MNSFEVVTPEPDQWAQILAVDARNFGLPADSFTDPVHQEIQPLERFRVAWDADRIVGVVASVPLQLTLPGGVPVATTGVTWVSVSASHRRRGVLRRLIDEVHADGRQRGEPVQALFASEAGIYGRFGYGEITDWWSVELDAASARLHPNGIVDDDLLPVSDADDLDADGHVAGVFDLVRGVRAGEVNRTDARWRAFRARWSKPVGDAVAARSIVCDGGYATYRITPQWDVPERGGRPGHVMTVVDLMAATPAAHRSLWHRLVHTDLVATIRCGVLAPDDPLPLLLADQRWLRTTSWHDGLWLRVDDLTAAFVARRYAGEGRVTLSVDGQVVTIESDGQRGICVSGRAPVDLEVHARAVGPLLMGADRVSRLVAAGLIVPAGSEALRRAQAFFASDRPVHCSTLF